MSGPPLLIDTRPGFADRLERALREAGEPRLAAQVTELRVVAPCGCENGYCQSFNTAMPIKRWFRRGRSVRLEDFGSFLVAVDVVDGEIAYVEVIDQDGLP